VEVLESCLQVSRKQGDWPSTVLFLIGSEFAIAGLSGFTKGKKVQMNKMISI